MKIAITCSGCHKRFRPDEIIVKVVSDEDTCYYCPQHITGHNEALRSGAGLNT